MRLWQSVVAVGAAVAALAGCEGVITGKEIARVELQSAEGGSFAPATFALTTDMNPIAFNFRADFSQNPEDFGRWNTYRITLSKGGNVVESRNINVNHPISRRPQDGVDPPPPTSTVHPLFTTDIEANGEYELKIRAVKTPEIRISNASVDVRRNVARGPQ